uniref:Uncharacterized protein n=1 Tax=Salarias fasciatus TaxID=181472 RepID=A0A672HID7_SALFA
QNGPFKATSPDSGGCVCKRSCPLDCGKNNKASFTCKRNSTSIQTSRLFSSCIVFSVPCRASHLNSGHFLTLLVTCSEMLFSSVLLEISRNPSYYGSTPVVCFI